MRIPTYVAGLCALSLAGFSQSSVVPTPERFGEKRLRVIVADAANDDAPVAGAFVELPGYVHDPGAQGHTDRYGAVDLSFVPDEGVATVKIFVHPQGGRTFGAKEVPISASMYERVFVLPEDLLSTGMLDPTVRNELTLAGMAESLDGPMPFDLRLTIPAGTFSRPFRLNVSPRPPRANFWNGIEEPSYVGGVLHVTPRDENGDRIADVLAHPVTFDHPQYFMEGLPLVADRLHAAGQPLEPVEFRVYRYDCGSHTLVDMGTPAEVDVERGRLRYDVRHLSALSWLRD